MALIFIRGFIIRLFINASLLVCDLVEPFRPLVDDRIRKAYQLGQIKPGDFTVSQGAISSFWKEQFAISQIVH